MNKVLLVFFLLSGFFSFSQTVPQKINYQGVARHADGTAIMEKDIVLRFRLLQGSPSGNQVFVETRNLNTGLLGVFSHVIGSISNTLNAVSWSAGPYFLEVAIDTTNTGSSFLTMGTQELVSVPYALQAGSAPSPSVSFNNITNVLNVGTNSVTLNGASGSASTSINTSGATTSALNGYTYNIHTPSVTVSAAELFPGSALGLAQIAGSYPNFSVVVAPTVVYNPTVGVLQFLSNSLFNPSYNYTYNITPQLALSLGNVLSVGPPTNSVQLVTGPSANATITSSGSDINVTQIGPNNFDISSTATFTGSGGVSVTGGPNYTITSSGAAANTTLTSSSSNINVTQVSPNNFDLSSPITFTGSGGTTVTGGPNYTISSSAQSFSLTGTGAAMVTPSGNNYTISVLPTIVSSGAGISVTGSAPNFTVNSLATTPTITGSGAANVNSTGNSHTVSVVPTLVSSGTGISIAGSAPNFTVNSLVSTPTITGTGMANVNSVGNNHTIDVPTTSLTGGTGINVSGSAPNFTINSSVPTTSVSGTGAAIVTASGSNYTVSVPVTTLVGIGSATVTGSAPNFTVNTPAKVSVTGGALFYPSGLLQVMGAYPNYSLLVAPSIAYSQQTGSLTLSNQPLTSPTYTYSYDITPALTKTNNVIQSGPAANTVAIVSPAAQATVVSGSGAIILGGVTFTQGTFIKQSSSSEIDIFVHTKATATGLGAFSYEIVVDGNTSLVSTPHSIDGTLGGNTEYMTLRGVFSGLSTGSHTVGIKVTGVLGLPTTLNGNGSGPAKLILKETY